MSLLTSEIKEGVLLAGRYRVLRRLGAGGMATVFLAEDERLGREVAIKRLHTDAPEASLRRFEQEARLGAGLNHPNLVAIYDTVAAEEGALIVMEYVEGRSLAELAGGKPMKPSRVLPILRCVADALDHAHAQGVVHRDVKPGNVIVGEDGTVKLADLGIARVDRRQPDHQRGERGGDAAVHVARAPRRAGCRRTGERRLRACGGCLRAALRTAAERCLLDRRGRRQAGARSAARVAPRPRRSDLGPGAGPG